MLAPTLNSRTIRSVMISRCSSPIPRMIVWPVSWSVWTLKVGSSCMSLREGHAHLFLVGLRLGLDRDRDDRLGEVHRLEDDRGVLVADRVAGRDVPQADGRRDVAGPDLLDLLALVGVHLEQPADALAWSLGRVEDGGAGVEVPRVDAEEGELADEGVGHDLEDERREGRVVLAARGRARRRRRRARSIGGMSSGDGR